MQEVNLKVGVCAGNLEESELGKQANIMGSINVGSASKKYPYNFGVIPREYSNVDSAVYVICISYDSANNPIMSSRGGPGGILRASRNLELFDSELGIETYKIGIYTMDEVEPNSNCPFENSQVVEAVVGEVLNSDKFPVVVGGDHSLTLGAVRAAANKYQDLGVVIFDAHPDLFDEYESTKYGHASVARRIDELGIPLSIVGVRTASRDETEFINKSGITVVGAREVLKSKEAFEGVLSMLPERVYLSVDVDVMDPGEMPAVANPEPGGLGWYDMEECFERLISKKTVVSFDVVELCPIMGNPTPDFIAAKLIYRLIGLIFRDKLLSVSGEQD